MKILDKLLSFANTLAGDYYGKDKKQNTQQNVKLQSKPTKDTQQAEFGREL